MRRCRVAHLLILGGAVVPGLALAAPAEGLVISRSPTRNVVCSAGVCTSAATSATLNVDDLAAMLAASSVTVKTGERGPDITVEAPLTWSGTNALVLYAYGSVRGNRPIAVPAGAGLQFLINGHFIPPGEPADGTLSFGPHGHVTFANLSSLLAINGIQYTLVNSLAALAAAVANYSGSVAALASDYDAGADGVYARAPISTYFSGSFEGLGNRISGLRVRSLVANDFVGLFAQSGGSITNLSLDRVVVKGVKGARIGGLVADAGGLLRGDTVSGQIVGRDRVIAGGLAGSSIATVDTSSSSALVQVGTVSYAGGLIGEQGAGGLSRSYATGLVSGGNGSYVGGLVGIDEAPIVNTYATGVVTGGLGSIVGGLIAMPNSSVAYSYSSGAINSQNPGFSGGFAGDGIDTPVCVDACYWDTTTSGTTAGIEGGNVPSIQPLTTSQLQTGLPAGFDATVWGQESAINGGLPYLLASPPQ